MSNGNQYDRRNTARSSGLPICYSVDDADFSIPLNNGPGAYVAVDALSATRTITLPTIAGVPFGFEVIVKDTGGNIVNGVVEISVACFGTQTIDNSAPYMIDQPFGYVVLRRHGFLGAKFDKDQYAWAIVGKG